MPTDFTKVFKVLLRTISVSCLAFLLCSATVRAGLRFEPVPLRDGAEVASLASDGTNLWAGTLRGVWVYSSGRWSLDGLSGLSVRSVAYADGALWAAADDSIYRRSVNGIYEIQTLPPETIAISVLLGQGKDIYAGGSGVLRRTNGRWETIPGLGSRAVTSLLLDGTILYAGLTVGGVARFDGAAWTLLESTEFPTGALAVFGGKLYAALSQGLSSWALPSGPWKPENLGVQDVMALSTEGGVLRAATASSGIRRLDGTSWVAENSGLNALQTLSFAAWGSSLVVGTGGGPVYRLIGGGWDPLGSGLAGQSVAALSIGTPASTCGGVAGTMFSGGSGIGINASVPPGQAPCPASAYSIPQPCSDVKALAQAGTNEIVAATECGPYFSNQFSGAFLTAGLGSDPRLTSLASTPQGILGAHINTGVFRFLGSGWSSDSVGLPSGQTVQTVAYLGGTAYAATFQGLFSRKPSGLWSSASQGLPSGSYVAALAGDGPVFAGLATGGVYRKDGGLPWKKDSSGVNSAIVLALDASPLGVFAGASEKGVVRKSEGGWIFENEGLPDGSDVRSLRSSSSEKGPSAPQTERRLYVGTFGQGLYAASLTPDAKTFPVVLDAAGFGKSRFKTELTLGNRSDKPIDMKIRFVPAPGFGKSLFEEKTVTQALASGTEIRIPDAIEFLRSKGVQIPSDPTLSIAGSLSVTGDWPQDPGAATGEIYGVARTFTSDAKGGTFGTSFEASSSVDTAEDQATVYGFRRVAGIARSNLAVVHLPGRGEASIELSVQVFAKNGAPAGEPLKKTLAPGEWYQFVDVLGMAGLPDGSYGYARVTRTAGTGTWSTYGVVNDDTTSDGSILPAYRPGGLAAVRSQLVPVVLDAMGANGSRYTTEVTFVNNSSVATPVELNYQPAPDFGADEAGGPPVSFSLAAREQRTIPDIVAFLRQNGYYIPNPAPGKSQAGTLLVDFQSRFLVNGDAGETVVLARTSTPNPDPEAGGTFGVFYKSVAEAGGARTAALIPGLSQNAAVRSNLAVVHTGGGSDDEIELTVQLHRASDGGLLGNAMPVKLFPGDWRQLDNVITASGVTEPDVNAYAVVTRTAGDGNFLAYGIINDNKTSDGSYIEMIPQDPN